MVILKKNEKQIPQYLHFRCGMTHINYSLIKLGKTFKMQKEFLKTEMNHDEVDDNKYNDKKDEWLNYVNQDVLCTDFSFGRNCKSMDENTGFSKMDCLCTWPRMEIF